MVFSSTLFLLYFLPAFLLVYHISADKLRNYVVLLFSLFFYSWGAPKFIFTLLFLTGIDFFVVKKMFSEENVRRRKLWLTASIMINMGLLFYFKYSNFFIENVNHLLGVIGMKNIGWTKLVLPIGISFFTFETLTYSIDAYRKVITPLKKLTDYYLYIFLFPKLIAGPIVRFSIIEDQMSKRTILNSDFIQGFLRFTIGLGKKILIANILGKFADDTIVQLAGEQQVDSTLSWLAILSYTFQIYFDFSGYSDMAIGIGRMIGFKFPENFDNPYTSSSISEFWRRWHMTLGMWMREYLYIPLGGNKVNSKSRLYFNLWLVFLLSGLWHGASWNFILWGAFHGSFLILDRLFLLKVLDRLAKPLSVAITFFIVMIGWVMFRVEEFWLIKRFMKSLFKFDFHFHPDVFTREFVFTLVIATIFSFFALPSIGRKIQQKVYFDEKKESSQFAYAFVSVLILATSLSYITTTGFNPFIYFRF
jgi:alginate O-acetyltransferase complex protein AlgI